MPQEKLLDATAPEPDQIAVRVRVRDGCIELEIDGVQLQPPVLLSTAAGRELAANLVSAADRIEPED